VAAGDDKLRRGPPAFQMYAPDRLADRNFKAMSVGERGLLHTIELECWVNGSVPAEPWEMARTLGLDVSEVSEALTARVWRYLERRDGSEPVIVCPDLEEYRNQQAARRAGMSAGGKKGAENRWKGKQAIGLANGDPNGPLRGEERKGEERKGVYMEEHEDFIKGLEGNPPFMQDQERGAGPGIA